MMQIRFSQEGIIMNIIIAGGGMVGSTLSLLLCAEGHSVTMVDSDQQILDKSMESYDVIGICGNCASMETLYQAGVMDADLIIAVTSSDEINLLCCTVAHGLNPSIHAIARIRTPEYAEQATRLRNIFGLSLVIDPDRQAAIEIERLLQYPGFLKLDSFAKGRTQIVELRITADSKLCKVGLIDMYSIVKCRVLVCAVIRDGKCITPRGDFIMEAGDRIFVTAPSANLTTLLKNLGIINRRVRRCMICGGSRLAYHLARFLERHGIQVTLIEQDYEKCKNLTVQLPNITVIHGDATDHALLDSEGIQNADALISLTSTDELNMIISFYAQQKGVPQVITKLRRGENRQIIDSLGLGSVVSPKELCSNTIARYVRAMGNQVGAAVSVHSIADGQAEAVEFVVDKNTKNCGTPLKDIALKPGILLVSITRGSRTEIPSGMSSFYQGDTVVVVTNSGNVIHQLNEIFA